MQALKNDTINEQKQKIDEQSALMNKQSEKIKVYEIKQQQNNIEINNLSQQIKTINDQLNEQSMMMQDFMNTICEQNEQIQSLKNDKPQTNNIKKITNLTEQNQKLTAQIKTQTFLIQEILNKNIAQNQQIQLLKHEIEDIKDKKAAKKDEEYNIFMDLLLNGYFRQIEQEWNICRIPNVVMDICSTYFMSLLHSINVIKGDNDCIVDLYNSILTTNGSLKDNKCTFCILQVPYLANSGIHKYALKSLVDSKKAISFGIVSNKEVTGASLDWLFDLNECGISYQLYVHHESKNAVYCFKNGHEIYCEYIQYQSSYKKEDVMSMMLDCNEWKITFFINSKQCGKSINIEPNTYYPAIAYNVCMADSSYLDQIKIKVVDF